MRRRAAADNGPPLPGTGRATLAVVRRGIMEHVDAKELGATLRTWRERVAPAEAGLPSGAQRRTPGLRREEVAHLAGLSVDYLARLEQGRARNPSPSVLEPLARALRLTDDEREHLFRLAGHGGPERGTMRRHLTPSIQRILDRLADTPVLVVDAALEVVAWNPLFAAVAGDPSGRTPRERNVAWGLFTGAPSRFSRDVAERARIEEETAADLREAAGRYPDDPRLAELIADLRAASPRFEALWQERPVAPRQASRKTVVHPEAGPITFDCDALEVNGTDLRLVIYTAVPGSPDEAALALVGALGLQTFGDAAHTR